jgi:hypothetical protein
MDKDKKTNNSPKKFQPRRPQVQKKTFGVKKTFGKNKG